jgi:hypothetical protein
MKLVFNILAITGSGLFAGVLLAIGVLDRDIWALKQSKVGL